MKKGLITIFISLIISLAIFNLSIVAIASNSDDLNEINTRNREGCIETEESIDNLKRSAANYNQYKSFIDSNANSIQYFPSSCDNSQSDAFPVITNQIYGSCVSYALTYYQMTYQYNKLMGTSAKNNANVFAPAFPYNLLNGGCDRGVNELDCYKALESYGAPTLDKLPIKVLSDANYLTSYHAKDDIWNDAIKHRISGYYYVDLQDDNTMENTPITSADDKNLYDMKKALSSGNVLTFSTEDFKGFYSGNNTEQLKENTDCPDNEKHLGELIIKYCTKKDNSVGHMMTIVGYDDNIGIDINGDGKIENAERGAFKVANSHGFAFGNRGYIWVSYDALNRVSSVNNSTNIVNVPNRKNCLCGDAAFGMIIDKNQVNKASIELILNTKDRSTINMNISALNSKLQYGMKSELFNPRKGKYSINGIGDDSDATIIIPLESICSESMNADDIKSYTYEELNSNGLNIHLSDEVANDGSKLVIKQVNVIDNVKNTKKYLLTTPLTLDGKSIDIPTKEQKLKIDGIKFDKKSPQLKNSKIDMHINTNNIQANLDYRMTIKNANTSKIVTILKNTGNGDFVWEESKEAGTYIIKVEVKNNATNESATYSCSYELKDSELSSSNTWIAIYNKKPAQVGDTINLLGRAAGGIGEVTYRFFCSYNGGKMFSLNARTTDMHLDYKLTKPGNYTFYVKVMDSTGAIAMKSTTIKVVNPVKITDLQLVQGDNKYIYINQKMTGTITSKDGYGSLKYSVDIVNAEGKRKSILDSGSSIFSWIPEESGKYVIEITAIDQGGYTDKYSKEIEIFNPIISGSLSGYDNYRNSSGRYTSDISLEAYVRGGLGSFKYKFGIVINGKEIYLSDKYITENKINFKPYELINKGYSYKDIIGSHDLFVYVMDSRKNPVRIQLSNYRINVPNVSNLNVEYNDSSFVGDKINIYSVIEYAAELTDSDYSMIITNGFNTKKVNANLEKISSYSGSYITCSAEWIPEEPGEYTITLEYTDKYGQKASKEIKCTVYEKQVNTVSIYYSGYDNPYIHYKVGNGEWTAVPGIEMEKCNSLEGYPYKFTIDLKEAENLTACFNDGNGHWDSNCGNNYIFTAGYYTYINGKITAIDNPDEN